MISPPIATTGISDMPASLVGPGGAHDLHTDNFILSMWTRFGGASTTYSHPGPTRERPPARYQSMRR
ncbi:hypothetical protein CCYS_02490 [Corynebacterium cystitidis DSM 20524]|uniref:Uncharacterized protein n=1 Tax=Corynebacterium cystitidis DSM 20524 TaxID=1121357 RepID=A0A1H9RFV5_9CORY|nr:hypothetical protein [Corynebacterium cystitidis]WJY81471.1 hypothetical protein CCYS_02490 [Corynebacterium cystitidis DSM 20524]SER70829.1 hypothetical protein SAMN05661109_00860 [Corynebacterium cystitidis DSM 20524]SNV87204.1 Uncharacterised protein [Corynebacterium cystitidis]